MSERMEITIEETSMLLGQKVIEIYLLNKKLAALELALKRLSERGGSEVEAAR